MVKNSIFLKHQESEMSRYGAIITLFCVILQITYTASWQWNLPKKCTCQAYADIAIAYDDSGSVGNANFKLMKQFMSKLVCSFSDVGRYGTQFGSFCFAQNVKKHFFLKKYDSAKAIKSAIENFATRNGGATATGDALAYARKVFFKDANTGAQARGYPQKVLIVMTDGKSNKGLKPKEEAQKLKDAGVQIVVIGVGSSVNINELKAIASGNYVFTPSAFSRLNSLLPHVVGLLCRVTRRGPRGVRGLPGPPGKTGPRGAPGAQGEQGNQGFKGQKGQPGPTGADGHMGERGPQGTAGDPGPPGQNGKPGIVGKTGKEGGPGLQGSTGDAGDPGSPGKRGPPGGDGKRGPKGLKGPKGNNGISGQKGAQGPKGNPGKKGKGGRKGPKGPEGNVGAVGDIGMVGGIPEPIPPIKGNRGPAGPPGPYGKKGHDGNLQIVIVKAEYNKITALDPNYSNIINPGLDACIQKAVNQVFMAQPKY